MKGKERTYTVELTDTDLEALAAYSHRALWSISPCFDMLADTAAKDAKKWIMENYENIAGAVQLSSIVNAIIMNALRNADELEKDS